MNGRCKKCNAYINIRQTRGSKLSDHKCRCGGELEIVISCPDGYKNKKGDLFTAVYENGWLKSFRSWQNPNNGAVQQMVDESVHAWNESAKNQNI